MTAATTTVELILTLSARLNVLSFYLRDVGLWLSTLYISEHGHGVSIK